MYMKLGEVEVAWDECAE